MKKLAQITHKLFYDNKALMVFSFVVAIVIWLVVVIALSPIDTAIVKDVPVSIELANSIPAQFDLEIFGQSDFSVDVEVKGKRYILSSVADKNSIKVVAQTAYVDSAGKHTLALKATKLNENDEFEIISLSEDFIEVFFDVYMEQDFPIEAKINLEDDELVDKGYVAGDAVLSADTVTVSGPATEVMSIKKVCAEMTVEKALNKTRTQAAKINAYNESGAVLHYLSFNYGNSDITVTLPIYYVVNKPASVSFINTPLDYIDAPFKYTISPANIKAGIQGVDKDSQPQTVTIATIDYADLKPGKNKFTVPSDAIPSVFSLETFKNYEIVVEVTGCTTKTLGIPKENITFINAPEGYKVLSVEKSIGNVVIVGPESSLEKINVSDVIVTVDLANADINSNSQEFEAKLSLKNSTDCWVNGKYSVTVSN